MHIYNISLSTKTVKKIVWLYTLKAAPSRGPLSPYLFVLCMEVLDQKISRAVENHQWRLVNLSCTGPNISYIFFRDDLLLFGEASVSQARLMEHTLAAFCGISGQRINCSKLRIWFSPNTPLYLKNTICTEFGVLPKADLGSYLGVTLVHGRLRRIHFKFLVEKAEKRLAGWKIHFQSKAAQTVLIKMTLKDLPIYSMQIANIPKSIINYLERLCQQFFWGESPGTRRQHIVSWRKSTIICDQGVWVSQERRNQIGSC